MKITLGDGERKCALLDVRNSKLYIYESDMEDLVPLVEGEAQSLELILNRM